LWVANKIVAKKFGTRQLRFPSITKNAVGSKLPNIPVGYAAVPADSGLSPTEIKNALAASGIMYLYANEKIGGLVGTNLERCIRLSHFLYSFVESGLPVILCLDSPENPIGHVIAAVGHFLPSKVDGNDISSIYCATGNPYHNRHLVVSSAINQYYAHDDDYGPYNRVTLKVPEEKSPNKCLCQRFNFSKNIPIIDNPPGLKVELGSSDKSEGEFRLIEAIVPVHFRIRNDSWDSLLVAIDNYFDPASEEIEFESDTIFLWRSFLSSGSDFKQSIVKRNYSSIFLKFYMNLHMPKYIWIHELTQTTLKSIKECFPSENGIRNIDGEILIDATSPMDDIRLVSARIGDVIWTATERPLKDPDASAFECFDRKQTED
jgi:hypothetical protein